MMDNYKKITRDNLARLYDRPPGDLAHNLPGVQEGDRYIFPAFGEICVISPDGISLGGASHPSAVDILISLYAQNARPDACVQTPFKAFREFPDSGPYVVAFASHTEQVLVPHVEKIKNHLDHIRQKLNGREAPAGVGGDFSILVYPLPKIALCYIFYLPDDEFPAAVTCLFSSNARLFLPVDGLADTGEYTSRKIIEIAK